MNSPEILAKDKEINRLTSKVKEISIYYQKYIMKCIINNIVALKIRKNNKEKFGVDAI